MSQTLSSRLAELIRQVPEQGLEIQQLVQNLGREGLLLLSVVVSLPFLLPVSIPGVSTVFGALILLIGIAETFGIRPWLPKKVASYRIEQGRLNQVLKLGSRWVERMETLSRPRWEGFVSGMMGRLHGLVLAVAAGLLMLPLALIPFSNTLPAIACILISAGLANRDGWAVLLGWLFVFFQLCTLAQSLFSERQQY